MPKDIFDQVTEDSYAVMQQAEHVSVNAAAVESFARKMKKQSSLHNLCAFLGDLSQFDIETQLRLAAAIDFSNARTWGKPKWGIPGLGGSNTLNAVYLRALKDGRLWTSAMTSEEYLKIVDCGTGVLLPRWEERWQILRNGVGFFEKYYGGSVSRFLESKKYDVNSISAELLEHFPNFRDECTYKGRQVRFYKLLQLIIFDWDALLLANGHRGIEGTRRRTGLADYKIPQILRYAGVMEYSPTLAQKVDRQVLLPYGSAEEVEIRAGMVVACDQIGKLAQVPASVVGDQAWLDSQTAPKDLLPHHRTETLFY